MWLTKRDYDSKYAFYDICDKFKQKININRIVIGRCLKEIGKLVIPSIESNNEILLV